MQEHHCPALRVLIVDDCPDTRATLTILLHLWGHDTRVAPDGPTALELARAFRPDVVLLDVGLPGMDGYEVARRLHQLAGLEHLFLLTLSGYATEEDHDRSREAGCDQHLVKPLDPEVLRDLLASRQGLAVQSR
jgi:two-component system CheB/CheR fusion protein